MTRQLHREPPPRLEAEAIICSVLPILNPREIMVGPPTSEYRQWWAGVLELRRWRALRKAMGPNPAPGFRKPRHA